jgi:hypothetical protein
LGGLCVMTVSGQRVWGRVSAILAIGLASALLAGCSSQFDNLAAPTPTQVSTYASETGKLMVFDGTKERQMYSSEYLLASINYSNQRCDEFFDKLARYQQDSSFADKVLASAIAAGTPLLAVYKASEAAIATTGAALALTQNVNKFASEIYAYSAHAGQLRRHVKDQMADFLKNREGDWTNGRLKLETCKAVGGCYNELERMVFVRGQAQAYANICSVTNLKAIVESSLSNTKSTCDLPGTGASAGAAALSGSSANCESKSKDDVKAAQPTAAKPARPSKAPPKTKV